MLTETNGILDNGCRGKAASVFFSKGTFFLQPQKDVEVTKFSKFGGGEGEASSCSLRMPYFFILIYFIFLIFSRGFVLQTPVRVVECSNLREIFFQFLPGIFFF